MKRTSKTTGPPVETITAPDAAKVAEMPSAKTASEGSAAKKIKTPKPAAKNKAAEKPKAPAKVKAAAKLEPKVVSKPVPKPVQKSAPKSKLKSGSEETAKVLDSKVVYEGKLFRVLQDHIIEPGGRESQRDVIRHNGSVVILAVDPAKHKKDPWVVVERQYRHAAGQFLWELPAGKLDAGEAPVDGAKRELAEETGYSAKKWSPLVEYYASPGFLGESMKVFLAEGLIAGDAHPEEDEHIDFRLVRLSDLLEMVDKGKIIDGKTLTTLLLYARQLGLKRKK
ncbi:MAG TPA: NUDIX hydrolase [Acidobacteriaceae bacterium]|nr:NUDIX hydrolase [Acidobacteriaceae bacterium]